MQTRNYYFVDDFLDYEDAVEVRALVQKERRWRLHEESFFSQFDVSWARRTLDQSQEPLLNPHVNTLRVRGRQFIEANTDFIVGNRFLVVAHKMAEGQFVGVHNDSPERDRGRIENLRLIFYVDDSFSDENGGHLVLLGSRSPEDILDVARPLFNSVVAMTLSDHSFHAVTKIRRGVRFCVVISYWGYAPLHTCSLWGPRVQTTLRRLIDVGAEFLPHSGTSFADHLFGTYQYLSRWEVQPEICIAGLLHSGLGRSATGIKPLPLSKQEVIQLVGDTAFALISQFAELRTFDDGPAISTLPTEMLILEIANTLEQARGDADLMYARRLINSIENRIEPAVYERIAEDFVRIERDVKSAERSRAM